MPRWVSNEEAVMRSFHYSRIRQIVAYEQGRRGLLAEEDLSVFYSLHDTPLSWDIEVLTDARPAEKPLAYICSQCGEQEEHRCRCGEPCRPYQQGEERHG